MMQETKMSEEQKDENGCLIGKETWDKEQQKCVPITANSNKANIKNPSVKMTMNEAFSKIVTLERQLQEKDELIENLTQHLHEANEVLDSQKRAEQIKRIKKVWNGPDEALNLKSNLELDIMEETLAYGSIPRLNSVRFGALSANETDADKGLTVGDLSVVTAAKRKRN
jgi:hypothetical protein